jgi:hypothetical protein
MATEFLSLLAAGGGGVVSAAGGNCAATALSSTSGMTLITERTRHGSWLGGSILVFEVSLVVVA